MLYQESNHQTTKKATTCKEYKLLVGSEDWIICVVKKIYLFHISSLLLRSMFQWDSAKISRIIANSAWIRKFFSTQIAIYWLFFFDVCLWIHLKYQNSNSICRLNWVDNLLQENGMVYWKSLRRSYGSCKTIVK